MLAWVAELPGRAGSATVQANLEEAMVRLAELEGVIGEEDGYSAEADAAEQQIKSGAADLESARHDLSLVTVESPIDGIIVRRNIEEGETVVIGTMNNAGTVLMTIADMSVIEAQIEVDETDIPALAIGQPAKVTIDALPDQTFPGHVTEIGNSPINSSSAASAVRQATTFKVVVTLDGDGRSDPREEYRAAQAEQ